MFQRFPQYILGLWHRSFIGIHQQQHAVHHVQNPFYFAAKVSVPWCIQNVDLATIVNYGSIFCQDSNATFPFLIIGVHDTFLHHLIGTENPALFQHGVDQRGLTMVYVGNDGNITQIISNHISLFPSYYR